MFFTALRFLTKKSWWMDVVFYFLLAILIGAIFSYGILFLKIYLQKQKITNTESNIAVYGTPEQKAYEQKMFDYAKLIDDFSVISSKHKISSNIFAFIEDNTLPNVWFSNFDMSDASGEMRLLGEVENMLTLSHQVHILEENKDYIKNISVLSSTASPAGKVSFILNLSLGPKIFSYQPLAIPQ